MRLGDTPVVIEFASGGAKIEVEGFAGAAVLDLALCCYATSVAVPGLTPLAGAAAPAGLAEIPERRLIRRSPAAGQPRGKKQSNEEIADDNRSGPARGRPRRSAAISALRRGEVTQDMMSGRPRSGHLLSGLSPGLTALAALPPLGTA